MKSPSLLSFTFLLALSFGAIGEELEQQPVELAPVKTKDGVRFQVEATEARKVFLAGTFNNWADNKDGAVSDDNFAMLKGEGSPIWTRYVALEKGEYALKFVVETDKNQTWIVPTYWTSRDRTGNARFWITGKGNPYLHRQDSSKYATTKVPGEVTFTLLAPGLEAVYVAGEFNNWADNKEGLVTAKKFAMDGPDKNGVWKLTLKLASGRHPYQFVLDGDTWIHDPNQESEDTEFHSVIEVE